MSEDIRDRIWARCGDTTPQDRRNLIRMLWTLAAWAVCFLGVTLSIKRELLPAGPISWAAATLPPILAVLAVIAYSRYLSEADELQRMIHLRALALGFAAGWIVLSGYPLFERLGAPAADSGDFNFILALFYSIGILIGWRRYR